MTLLNHTAEELGEIKNHTIKSFDNDVKPLFDNSQRVGPEGGVFHFGIISEVMAYIELCGAIYWGWQEKNNKGQFDTRKVTTSDKSIHFMGYWCHIGVSSS